jgi:hypothetical protein
MNQRLPRTFTLKGLEELGFGCTGTTTSAAVFDTIMMSMTIVLLWRGNGF